MTVYRTTYTPPVFKHACSVCDHQPAIYYKPAQEFLCGACILDYQACHAPKRQAP
jgi:hypothetical protein